MAGDLINGEIPEHWEFTTLGEICQRGGGSIQTGPFGSQLHASDYVSVGVPSIMPTNIGENRIVEDGIVRITEEDANRLGQASSAWCQRGCCAMPGHRYCLLAAAPT